jgi:hypothetical protein
MSPEPCNLEWDDEAPDEAGGVLLAELLLEPAGDAPEVAPAR